MNGLDLFSGIGGISIALKPWVRTVVYCEQDRYAQSILLSRMSEGKLEKAPIWDDVRTLTKEELPNIEIIFGGFPCQDISVAGNGKGLEGERSGLFFEIVRLAKETRAPFIFLENVPAIRTRGLSTVIRTLAEIGYDCRWTCLSASGLGAPHKRERWFLLAYSDSFRRWNQWENEMPKNRKMDKRKTKPNDDGIKEPMAHSNGKRLQGGFWTGRHSADIAEVADSSWWSTEPDVGRVAHGVPQRMDRIKCLGNSVVPQQAREAFKRLVGLK